MDEKIVDLYLSKLNTKRNLDIDKNKELITDSLIQNNLRFLM